MHNFFASANYAGISLKPKLYDQVIKNFTLNKETNYVEIVYFSTRKVQVKLEEDTLEKLKKEQEAGFNLIYKKVKKSSALSHGVKDTLIGVNTGLAIANFATGNIISGIACTCLGLGQLLPSEKYSLKKDMDIVKWLLEHQESVNCTIREEVNDKLDNNLNYAFPEDSLYTEEMYEEGINLNNMDSLNFKELRELKKKVKKREKELKRSV